MALLGEKMSVTGGRASAVYEFFDSIMMPESAAKFRERGQIGVANPIGMRAITEVIPWLMEVYGLRPTQPSDESSDGSEPTDTSSTDGA
jgi:hypothetical protein